MLGEKSKLSLETAGELIQAVGDEVHINRLSSQPAEAFRPKKTLISRRLNIFKGKVILVGIIRKRLAALELALSGQILLLADLTQIEVMIRFHAHATASFHILDILLDLAKILTVAGVLRDLALAKS